MPKTGQNTVSEVFQGDVVWGDCLPRAILSPTLISIEPLPHLQDT